MKNCIYSHPFYGEMYYLLDVPDNIPEGKKVPLLIFLHGAGERGTDFELIKKNAVPRLLEEGKKMPGNCITVCPQCAIGETWNTSAHFLKAFIDDICETFPVDMKNINITGISMGGYGTWEMIMLYKGFFHKAAPVCGGGMSWRAPDIKIPVWAFHGDADDVVPTQNSYEMVDAVNRAGGNARLTLFHGVGHDSWDEAYEDTRMLEWLMEE